MRYLKWCWVWLQLLLYIILLPILLLVFFCNNNNNNNNNNNDIAHTTHPPVVRKHSILKHKPSLLITFNVICPFVNPSLKLCLWFGISHRTISRNLNLKHKENYHRISQQISDHQFEPEIVHSKHGCKIAWKLSLEKNLTSSFFHYLLSSLLYEEIIFCR